MFIPARYLDEPFVRYTQLVWSVSRLSIASEKQNALPVVSLGGLSSWRYSTRARVSLTN